MAERAGAGPDGTAHPCGAQPPGAQAGDGTAPPRQAAAPAPPWRDHGTGMPPRQPGDGSAQPYWPGHWHRRRRGLRRWRRRPRGSGPLRRSAGDRLAGGVAAGIAARMGYDTSVVRAVFVVGCFISGLGPAVYVLAWLLVPAAGAETNIASKALSDRRGIALAAALGSALITVLLLASVLGAGWIGSLAWPLVISVGGMTLVWRNAPPDEQATIRRLAQPLLDLTDSSRARHRPVLRFVVAGLVLAAGLGTVLAGRPKHALLWPLGGLVLVIIAIVLALGPWWLRIARDLVAERQARARAEERSEMAARVHDSVLQTLALIQRRAHQPQQVIHLARAQERELRSWLFDGLPPGSQPGRGLTLAEEVQRIQQEVETHHEITVETVTVGDCQIDQGLEALLAAAREAVVNAAKWSGAPAVSLFAEVEPDTVVIYVRDRGRGFDPAAVPSDRKGLAESIHARVARRGGTASVRSAPGEGTEVSLTMPRTAGKHQPGRP